MKRYRCHKEVDASVIVAVDTSTNTVTTRDDAGNSHLWIAPEGFFARGCPDPGAYLVRYLPDGYVSWSPKSVFEDGYTAIDEPATGGSVGHHQV